MSEWTLSILRKPYSNIYWNNLETIAFTVELRAWIKVTQYHWHNCKEKISEKWRNIGENRKSEVYQVTLAIKVIILVIIALDFEEVWWFLAHLVMSLYNHALSVMWCCHCHHQHCCHWCLFTALPVTALIIETLYLANICIYIPSICTWNIM